MVLGVALGSLVAALIGMFLAQKAGHSLLDVPPRMWAPLLADCCGIGLYGIMSALATAYLPGAEVAFLLLIDVIVAPLLVCIVHGEIPTAAGSSGAALLAAAVIGHEFAALRDARLRGPPEVALARGAKARISDVHMAGLDSPGGSSGVSPRMSNEIEMSASESFLGGDERDEPGDERAQLLGSSPRTAAAVTDMPPAPAEKRVSWAAL